MSTTHFKFVEPDGVTRRVSFAEKPTWTTLATRIQSLFGIPIENVSVAYIDADNDQVTLSSQEELADYYATSHQTGQIIKFIVQDLSALRSHNDPIRSTQTKNPFSGDGVDLDDEWLGLGGVFVPRPGSDGPHAFVEVIESDAGNSTIRGVNPTEPSTTMSSPAPSFTAPLDKGKGRADPEEDSFSTASLLMADAPPKPPVHVYEHSFSKDVDAQSIPGSFKEGSLLDESTPTMQTKDTPMDQDRDVPPSTEDPTDPPLAPVDATDAHTTPASLTHDIAAVIQAFNNVLSSHPEISEGLRNIARNAANGTYWAAHRESISQAAQRVTQEAQNASEQIRRTSEQDAAQRVSEALNGFFRTFSQQVGDLPAESGSTQTPPPPPAGAPEVPPAPADSANAPPVFGYHPFGHRHPHMRGPDSRPPWMRWSSFPHHPPFDMGGPGSWGNWGRQFQPPPGPPPPPPPPPHHPHPHPPPPPPPHFSPTPGPNIPGAWNEGVAVPPPPPQAEPMQTHQEAEEHELKSKVQEAKARYKAEKQKYRSELDTLRQQRRHHFERPHAGYGHGFYLHGYPPDRFRGFHRPSAPVENMENVPPVPPARPPVERVIAVQGRKGNPTMEVVSVQRHHTFPGHRHHRRFEAGPSDITSRHVNRISRRLSDMGFTLTAYPDLQTRIRALMPTGGNFSPEEEDSIVTTLLEELLVLSPKPTAST